MQAPTIAKFIKKLLYKRLYSIYFTDFWLEDEKKKQSHFY